MKLAVLSLVVLAFGCGKYEAAGTNGQLGQSRAFSPLVADNSLLNAVTNICNALAQKNGILNSAVGSVHNFDASQTNCDGTLISTGNVQTTIQSFGSEFQFRKTEGTSFIFPNVETNTSGVMASICANLSNLQTQTLSANNEVITIATSGFRAEDCTPASGEQCIYFESGPLQGSTYTITNQEWIRFRVSSPTNDRVGFFTQRKKVARSFCGTNKSIQSRALLK